MDRRGRKNDGGVVVLKKGPWTVEEDEVLLEYVRKHGPRDWSSIKSKGLLPRSGKSCRLRWVNKLKPDLKTGCKFSAEEERIVIELQARFGNRWARIATYLQGRTDNDVKNFWSTRQKRLARITQQSSPPPQKKHQRNHNGKSQSSSAPSWAPPPQTIEIEAPANGHFLSGEESSNAECMRIFRSGECEATTSMLNSLHQEGLPKLEPPFPLLPEPDPDRKPFDTQLPHFCFPQLPDSLLDLPLLPEGHELGLGFADMSFPFADSDGLACDLFLGDGDPFIGGLGDDCINGLKMGDGIIAAADTPECNFFDDFPVELLDYSELPPPPPSSSEC